MGEPKKNREDYLDSSGLSPEEEKTGSFLIPRSSNSPTAKDLGEHLTELRNRIFIGITSLLASISLCFYFSAEIMKFLQAAAPPGASFFQLKPGELFMSSLKVSIFFGIIIALPFIAQQLAAFLKPGLKESEQKILAPLFWGSPILFYLGLAFSYYMVLPPLLAFLLGFRQGVVSTSYGLEHFLNLEMSLLALCGISFQLPIIIISLGQFNLVKSSTMLSIWRYVVLGAFIVAAILTPTPDPMTMSIVASALLFLYFGTVFFMRLIGK